MTVFAETFELVGLRHTRCVAPPTVNLDGPHTARSLVAPLPIGRLQVATFADRKANRVYLRLYHFDTGEVAWFEAQAVRS